MNIEIESPGLYTFSQYLSMYDLKKLHDPVLLITKVPYLLVQQDPVNTKSMCFSISYIIHPWLISFPTNIANQECINLDIIIDP